MAKSRRRSSRPAQGNNSLKKIVRTFAGGDNVNTGRVKVPRVNTKKPRGFTA